MIKNILIIEDEKPNSDRLKRLIALLRPNARILAVLETVSESVNWFSGNDNPDLVMMDVRLADGISFDIFEKIELKCPIIFTTAYDEYAVRAFKFNSVDYLLKPVEQEELAAAFEKLESITQTEQHKSIEGLMNFLQPKEFRSRFLLPYRDGYKTVLVSEISCFYSELKITRAKLDNGKEEIIPQTMEELESQLNPKCFFRANRQFIIHVDDILQVHNYFNGKLKVELKKNPELEILISREKAPVFKAWMDY